MRILFVNTRPPWPGRRGDQVRTAGFVGHLAGRHEVRVLALRDRRNAPADPPRGVELETVAVGPVATLTRLALGTTRALLGGPRPVQNGFYDHPSLRVALRRQAAEFQPDVVVLMLGRLGHLLGDLEQVAADVPVVVDLVDALSLNFAQRARRERLLAWLWNWESARLARWDASLAVRAAALTVVSERDRAALVQGAPEAVRAMVEQAVRVVPFGLPLDTSDDTDDTDDADDADDADEADDEAHRENAGPVVALTGNLGYFPTVDGALHFARHVWPEIHRRVPEARWLLAGARPAKSLLGLQALPGVELVADPPDLQAILATADVAIAPMRSGSGTPIKVLEAMAVGVPVVATPEAAAGLDELPPNALAVAGSDKEFAARVVELLTERARARRASAVARDWLRARHELSASATRFEKLLMEAALKA